MITWNPNLLPIFCRNVEINEINDIETIEKSSMYTIVISQIERYDIIQNYIVWTSEWYCAHKKP